MILGVALASGLLSTGYAGEVPAQQGKQGEVPAQQGQAPAPQQGQLPAQQGQVPAPQQGQLPAPQQGQLPAPQQGQHPSQGQHPGLDVGDACWAQLFRKTGLRGESALITGDSNVENFKAFRDGHKVRSLVVGADAEVTLYEDPNFDDDAIVVRGPAVIGDLDDTRLDDEAESMTLRCVRRY